MQAFSGVLIVIEEAEGVFDSAARKVIFDSERYGKIAAQLLEGHLVAYGDKYLAFLNPDAERRARRQLSPRETAFATTSQVSSEAIMKVAEEGLVAPAPVRKPKRAPRARRPSPKT